MCANRTRTRGRVDAHFARFLTARITNPSSWARKDNHLHTRRSMLYSKTDSTLTLPFLFNSILQETSSLSALLFQNIGAAEPWFVEAELANVAIFGGGTP